MLTSIYTEHGIMTDSPFVNVRVQRWKLEKKFVIKKIKRVKITLIKNK